MADDPALLASAEKHLDEDELKEALETAQKVSEGPKSADALRIIVSSHRREAEKTQTKPEEAERLAQEGLEKFKAAGAARSEALMLLCLSEINGERRGSKRRTKAERWAKQALAIFKRLGEKLLEAATLNQMAAISRKELDLDDAVQLSNDALAASKELGDDRMQALSLHGLAQAQALGGAFEDALQTDEQALVLVRKLGLVKMESGALCQMSQWQASCDRPQVALTLAQKALSLKEGNQETLANVQALARTGQPREAVQVAKLGLERAKKSGDQREAVVALRILARAQLAGGASDEALKTYEEALGIIRELKDRAQEFQMLHAMSAVYQDRRQFEKAMHPLRDAQTISQCPSEKAMTLRTLAELHMDNGNYDEALEAAEDAQEAFQQEGDRRGEAGVLMMASTALNLSGSLDQSFAKARLAYELVFVAGDLGREAVVLQMMAQLQMAQGKAEEALDALGKAVAAYNELGDKRGAAGTMRMIADMYLEAGQLQEAEEAAKAAQEAFAGAQEDEGDAIMQLLLARIYNRMYEKEKHDWFLDTMRMAADQAVASAARTSNTALQASAAFTQAQGLMLNTKAPPDEAMKMAKKAQTLFKDSGDRGGEAHSSILVSYMYMAQGENDKATESLKAALSLAQGGTDADAERTAQEALDFLEQVKSGAFAAAAGPVQMMPMEGAQMMAAPQDTGTGIVGIPSENALDPAMVKGKIMDLVRNAIGVDDEIHTESALMDAGMDSLSATDFTGQVAREFKLGTSPSLVFDFPTIREIVAHLVEESGG